MRQVRNLFSISAIILYCCISFAGTPIYTTFQTKIIAPSGLPLENPAVNFRFTILDSFGTCVLYIEDYVAVNMAGSSGVVSFSLGSGTKSYPGAATLMSEVFNNAPTVPLNCQAGGTYAPGSADRRHVVMQFNDGSGWQTLPQMAINSVFYANYATTSEKLGNYVSADYLRPATLPSCIAGQALHYNGTSFTCVAASGGVSGVTSVNVNSPLSIVNTTSTPVITLPKATGAISGYLSSTDWSAFNAKASASLPAGNLYVGNGSNAAAGVTLSGDATLNSSGDLSLVNSGVAAGSYGSTSSVPVLAIDSKGRVTSATSTPYQNATGVAKGVVQVGSNISVSAGIISLNSTDITNALGYTPPNATQAFIQNGNSFGAAANLGTSDNNNLNFLTSGTPKLTVQSNGNVGIGTTTPNYKLEVIGDVNVTGNFKINGTNISSGGGTVTNVSGLGPISVVNTSTTPVISIATAAAGVSGALSSSDWSIFNNKMNNVSSDITTALGYTPLNRLLNNGLIFVGSAGNIATGVAMSGDASILSSGNVTLTNSATSRGNLGLGTSATFNVPVAGDAASTEVVRGTDSRLIDGRAPIGTASGDLTGSYPNPTLTSTGVGAGTYTKVTVDTKGRVTSATVLSSGDLTTIGAFNNGGNSFSADASIGTNDNFNLSFKTNNTNKMTMLANGNVGIGTTTPSAKLHVLGSIKASSGIITTSVGSASGALTLYANDSINGGLTYIEPTASRLEVYAIGAQNSVVEALRVTNDYQGVGANGIGASVSLRAVNSNRDYAEAGAVTAVLDDATFTSNDGSLRFSTLGPNTASLLATEKMRINSSGNVGIGTTTPTYALSVSGDVSVTGNFKVNGVNIAAGSGTVTNVSGSGPISVVNSSTTPVISIATATAASSGALSSSDWSIFNSKMNNVSSDITTALGYTPLNKILTNNYIFVGSGGIATGVAMSGDATIVSSGSVTLTNSATTRGNLGLGTSATFNVPVAGDAASTEVVRGTDSRLIDSRAPMGTASGDLTGSYPSPTIINGAVTIAKLSATGSADATKFLRGDDTWSSPSVGPTLTSISSISNASGDITLAPAASTNSVLINSNMTSTSPTTGSLIVTGGIGASGNIYSGGTISAATYLYGPQIYGSTAASADIKIDGTSNASKGNVLLASAGGNVGIGTTAPTAKLEVSGRVIVGGSGTNSVMITGGNVTSTGSNTTFVGANAGIANTSGSNGTFVGAAAGFSNTSGNGNTFLGNDAGYYNITGTLNTFVGLKAGYKNDSGISSVAVGQGSAYENISGSRFVAVGRNAMNNFTATGSTYNVALGESAMYGSLTSSTGTLNTSLGGLSGNILTSGSRNIFLGYNSGSAVTTGSNNVVIGSHTGSTIATASNNIIIADGSGNNRIQIDSTGNVGIGTTTPAYKLDVIGDVNVTGNFKVNGVNISTGGGGGTSTAVLAIAGAAGAPSISFSADATTGFYNSSAGTIAVSSAGSNIFNFSSAGMVSSTTGGALIQTANGTSSTPTYSFAGDPGTGWYRPAANTMAASTGGLERLRINSTGNVGIGTTTPGSPLTVAGDTVAVGPGSLYFSNADANRISLGIGNTLGANPGNMSNIIAVGTGNNVGYKNSMAFGRGNNTGGGDTVIAVGVNNSNNGDSSGFFGNGNSAGLIQNSYAVGENNVLSASYNYVFGRGITNNIASSMQLGPSDAAKVTILSSGNVGIGTTTPGAKLEVAGNLRVSSGGLEVPGTSSYTLLSDNLTDANSILSGGFPATDRILLGKQGAKGSFMGTYSSNLSALRGIFTNFGTSDEKVFFGTSYDRDAYGGGSESGIAVEDNVVRIRFYGEEILRIFGEGVTKPYFGPSANGANDFTFYRGRGSAATSTPVQISDSLGAIGYWGTNGSNSLTLAAKMDAIVEGVNASSVGTRLAFSTAATGSAMSEKMTLAGSGNVGIGTSTPQTTLQVAGVISPATNNTYTLGNATYRFTEVYATNGVINTSDRREKKDIYDTDLGLDFINKLRPVSYRWNTGVDNDVHYGLIAQEAEQVIAEVGKSEKTSIVTHDETTDRYGVRYSELISPLIKAVQQLYSRLVGVDREIASVKAENEKLKQENAAIKAYLCGKDKKAAICK